MKAWHDCWAFFVDNTSGENHDKSDRGVQKCLQMIMFTRYLGHFQGII